MLLMVLMLATMGGGLLIAGTTGKIAGRVTDATTNEPLIGANVVVQGTSMGATTDIDGYYSIANLLPGKYVLVVSFVGYKRTTITNVTVKIDLTTTIDVQMQQDVVQGEEVIVRAERPLVQKDLTSTSVTVSSEELARIPTENIGQVVNLQAGVVAGHFRGGRSNEVAYLIDGVSVVDPYNGQRSIEIENTSIREMEVISGTFNAEYGQAMSGIVNIVTQEGSPELHGSISAYTGDYVTSHTNTFQNVGSWTKFRTRNVQGSLSGSIPYVPGLSFYATGRYYYDQGHLFGKRIYNVTDYAPTFPDPNDQSFFVNNNTGDGAYVAMNPTLRRSANAKVAYSIGEWKFSHTIFWDWNWNKYYDHSFAWTPDGIMNHYRENMANSFQITYAPSNFTYHTLKFSLNKFDYKGYLYEDPYDSRYVDPARGTPLSNYTFRSGGNQGDRYDRFSRTRLAQWAVSSQLDNRHKVGLGAEVRLHQIYSHGMSIWNQNTVEIDSVTQGLKFVLGYRELGSPGNQAYDKWPIEFSAYVQDKIEYDIMIINAGVRLDYFDPASSYPLDLRNPSKNPLFENAGVMKQASTKLQLSPRLGVSFPITDQGIIHFSYGHFFQIPSYENLYYNSDYLVASDASLSSIIGNPDLDAQRTVMYEVGLQQVLFDILGLDFTVYYRDIRNLLGMEIINTYEGIRYARFINRDYGNVKGFIFSLEKRFADFYSLRADYTFQIAQGNASDPYTVYYNNQSDPPIETNKKVVPLNWDQRNTLNISLTVGDLGNWSAGIIGMYGSGTPYTEDIRVSNGLRFENGGWRPSAFGVDLRAEKNFRFNGVNVTLFALVYNLLDNKNEYGINATSGRANIDVFKYLANPVLGMNTVDEYINNPANFSAPRQLRLGVTLSF